VFDTSTRVLYCLELKSTKQKSISFEVTSLKSQPKKMIHKHQIEGLMKFREYDYVVSGFVFNFRDEKNKIEHTYFQNIDDFNIMVKSLDKKSFNENDLKKNKSLEIEGTLKRVNYIWDLGSFFEIENK